MSMTKGKRTEYVGKILNGCEILEELENKASPDASAQLIHVSRRFRVIHLESGVEMIRTLNQMRNASLKMPWEYKNFYDFTDEVYENFRVIGLSAESCIPNQRQGGKKKIWWDCVSLTTNASLKHSNSTLMHLKRKREARRESERRAALEARGWTPLYKEYQAANKQEVYA